MKIALGLFVVVSLSWLDKSTPIVSSSLDRDQHNIWPAFPRCVTALAITD